MSEARAPSASVCGGEVPPRARLRFPKAARLSGSREFQRVKDEGRTWGGKFFVLSVLFEAEPGGSRFGIITSRRVGGAVVRARARRRLRETIRPSRAALRPGCWIVLIARHTMKHATLALLLEEWSRLGRRAGILPATPPARPVAPAV